MFSLPESIQHFYTETLLVVHMASSNRNSYIEVQGLKIDIFQPVEQDWFVSRSKKKKKAPKDPLFFLNKQLFLSTLQVNFYLPQLNDLMRTTVMIQQVDSESSGEGPGFSHNIPTQGDQADHLGHASLLSLCIPKAPHLSCLISGSLPSAAGTSIEYSDLILWVLLPGCHCKVCAQKR